MRTSGGLLIRSDIFNWLDLTFLNGFVGGFITTARHNHGELYEKALAEQLESNALLNSTVIYANRPSDNSGVSLVVDTPNGLKLILASQILVSITLIIPNMQPFSLDDREFDLFQRFVYSSYYTYLFNNTSLPSGQKFENVGINTAHNLPHLPGAYAINPTAVDDLFYFWYGSPFESPAKRDRGRNDGGH